MKPTWSSSFTFHFTRLSLAVSQQTTEVEKDDEEAPLQLECKIAPPFHQKPFQCFVFLFNLVFKTNTQATRVGAGTFLWGA